MSLREPPWFRQRPYGLGGTPVTWQGWALVVGFLVAVLVSQISPSPVVRFERAMLLTAPFILAVWLKTKDGWRWRWGRD